MKKDGQGHTCMGLAANQMDIQLSHFNPDLVLLVLASPSLSPACTKFQSMKQFSFSCFLYTVGVGRTRGGLAGLWCYEEQKVLEHS